MERPRISVPGLAFRQALWLPVVMLIVAVVAFGGARQMARDARLLASEGLETIGEVTRRERRSRTTSDGGTRYTYHVHYRFTTEAGQRMNGSQSVRRGLYDRAFPGVPIQVHYAPSRPSLNRVQRKETGLVRLVFLLFSGLLLLGSAALFWFLSGELSAKLRAIRRGVSGRAQVIAWREVKGKPSKSGRPPLLTMEWRDDGSNARGETEPRQHTMAEAFPAGSEITIWYDPRTERGYWEWEIMDWKPPSGAVREV